MGWQLAVLTGHHDGALAPLACASALIGSAPECDIVLTDPSVRATHAALALDPTGALVHALADAPLELHAEARVPAAAAPAGAADLRVAPFTAFSLGEVWLAVVPDDFAWTQLHAWPLPRDEATAAAPRRSGAALALALGLTLGIGLVAALTALLSRAPAPPAATIVGPLPLAQRLQALALPDLRITVLPDRVQVDGWVDSHAQFERLIAAVGSDGAPVRLNVRIGEEIARRAAEFIGPAVVARYDGGGRIVVRAASEAQADMQTPGRQAPGAASTPHTASAAGAPPAAAVAQRIERLRADLGAAVQIANEVTPQLQPAAPAIVQPIPVQIVEVQADDPAHFRTRDGTRYFVGGRLPDGAEVVRIATDEIVFRHGDRLIPYRLLN